MKEQNFGQFLLGKRPLAYEKFTELLSALGLTVGAKGNLVGETSPSNLREEFSKKIKSKGLTYKIVAQNSGVNSSVLSSFLSGRRKINVGSLEKLMVALDMEFVCYGEPQIYND